MEKIEEPEKIVAIRFIGKEVDILKEIALTDASVPKAVAAFNSKFSEEEVRDFLMELYRVLTS